MATEPLHDMSEYNYQYLPEVGHIRLLRLEPGKKEDVIRCHLEPVSMEDAFRTYECISYVWGDSTKLRRIIIDNHAMSVTWNLFDALQHFRDETVTKTLWVDALCIQQSNPPEKGRQVQLMGKIYENGLRTLVWLGLDDLGIAKETTAFLKSTSQVARDLTKQYGSMMKIPALSEEENPISQDVHKWKLFETFVNLSWFERVWVMQEVGIAPDVTMHWGDAELPLSDLINVNEFLRHVPHIVSVQPMSWMLHDAFVGLFMWYDNSDTWRTQLIPDILVEGARCVPAPNFIDALIQSSRRSATDWRDHVFALLGHPLAKMGDSTIVKADYERHVDDIYLEVSAKLLQHVDPTLPFSVAAGMGRRRPRDLDSDQPSWVARWELGRQTANLGRPGHWYYAGGKNVKANITIDSNAKTLTLLGVIFDKVTWFSDMILTPDIDLDKLIADPTHRPAINWVWDNLPTSPCRYPNPQARRDAFTLSLVSGRYKGNLEAEDDMTYHRRIAAAYSEYLGSMRGVGPATGGGGGDGGGDGGGNNNGDSDEWEMVDNPYLRAEARDYEEEYTWTAHDRRFMVTEKGFYGLGPQLLRAGDVVAVFPGVMIPYVLRETGQGNRYKLVGASYVHGVMRGEVLDLKDPLALNCGEPKEIVIV